MSTTSIKEEVFTRIFSSLTQPEQDLLFDVSRTTLDTSYSSLTEETIVYIAIEQIYESVAKDSYFKIVPQIQTKVAELFGLSSEVHVLFTDDTGISSLYCASVSKRIAIC